MLDGLIDSSARCKDPIADIGMAGLCDMEKLTKWIEESRLDPNDPGNADIMHLMRVHCLVILLAMSTCFNGIFGITRVFRCCLCLCIWCFIVLICLALLFLSQCFTVL